jgi:hypothetical protein
MAGLRIGIRMTVTHLGEKQIPNNPSFHSWLYPSFAWPYSSTNFFYEIHLIVVNWVWQVGRLVVGIGRFGNRG